MNGQTDDAQAIEVEIADEETIVRAVISPAHYSKKKLSNSVFRPPPGETSLSVMRQLMGDDFCKAKGVEIGKQAPDPQAYVGLLSIRARDIRAAGSTVTDSREHWLGHADLDHGIAAPAKNSEPSSAADLERLVERCETLKAASVFQKDPDREGEGWKGAPLRLD